MLPVKVEPPLMEMEDFPPIVYWAWPEFSKEPPIDVPGEGDSFPADDGNGGVSVDVVDRSGVVYIAITAANDCFDEAVVFLCSGKRDSVQVDCSRRAALNRCSGSGIA